MKNKCISHYGRVICFLYITSLENVNTWGNWVSRVRVRISFLCHWNVIHLNSWLSLYPSFHMCTSTWVFVWHCYRNLDNMLLLCCPGLQPGVPAPALAGSACRPAGRLSDRLVRSAARCCRLIHRLAQIFVPISSKTLVYMWYFLTSTYLPYMLISRWHVCSNKLHFY